MKQQSSKKIITAFFFLTSGQIWPLPSFCHFLVPDSFWEAMFLVLTDKRCCLWQDKLSLLSFFLSLISYPLPSYFVVTILSSPCCALPLLLSSFECFEVGFSAAPWEAADPCWVQVHRNLMPASVSLFEKQRSGVSWCTTCPHLVQKKAVARKVLGSQIQRWICVLALLADEMTCLQQWKFYQIIADVFFNYFLSRVIVYKTLQ